MLASLRTLHGTIAMLAIITSLLVGLFLGGGASMIINWLRPAISSPNKTTETIVLPTETLTIEPSAAQTATKPPKATATEGATERSQATEGATEAATETAQATATAPATRTPRATRTERPTETAEVEATETPEAEAEATETLNAEAEAIIQNGGVLLEIIANGNVNIREEPRGVILRSLASGTQAEVIGRSEDSQWVQVQILQADADEPLEGWISSEPEFVEIRGDINQLPITDEEANSES